MKNKELERWLEEITAWCSPDKVIFWHGTKMEYDQLAQAMVNEKKAIRLNEKLRTNCLLFRTDPSDVARVEQRTFISSVRQKDAGPTNNWIDPKILKPTMWEKYHNAMKGRTMYVIPFSMGPVGSRFSKLGMELTDSAYVTLNMHIMTRTGDKILDMIENGTEFVKCLHSIGYPLNKGDKDPLWPCAPIEEKYISHFPEENMIWSYGSGYGGNALLGKKCFALRIASNQARRENWLAEHMLILKLTSPEGKTKYITGAFPSACGKTNLAMIRPALPGWKAETVGDDIAWIRLGKDGGMYAINPEAGFFGVATGTSWESNPNAMESIKKDTIFTNVALTDDGDVWWEGMSAKAPAHLIDWHGNDWTPDSKEKAAHPNCRFTAPAANCPSIASNWEDPEGVPVAAMLFGGRRPSTIPLVHESFDFNHGVFLGSIMGSEITAATISNDIGKVRRDPFAMLPFIGYNIADYVNHWLAMGKLANKDKLPRIYYVNWFRKDSDGHFLWPGYGENIRVLKWIFNRHEGLANAQNTAIGYVPSPEDLDLNGLDIASEKLDQLLDVDIDSWLKEASSIKEYYASLYGDTLPDELKKQLNALLVRLSSHQ